MLTFNILRFTSSVLNRLLLVVSLRTKPRVLFWIRSRFFTDSSSINETHLKVLALVLWCFFSFFDRLESWAFSNTSRWRSPWRSFQHLHDTSPRQRSATRSSLRIPQTLNGTVTLLNGPSHLPLRSISKHLKASQSIPKHPKASQSIPLHDKASENPNRAKYHEEVAIFPGPLRTKANAPPPLPSPRPPPPPAVPL